MKRYAFAAMLLLTACQTAAEPEFTPIAGDELKALIAGKTVTFANNDMSTVLRRHYPGLTPALRGVRNAFAPWTRMTA